jgi:predicted acetyltransferase
MTDIRPIPDEDMETFARLVGNAYPSMDLHSAESIQRHAQRLRDGVAAMPHTHLYGLYREGALRGGMRLFDFSMNCHGARVPVGGVGLVAVDIQHKKQRVARDMLAWYLRHYRAQGAPLAALYPFRVDFYHAMGFGLGAKMHQYTLQPDTLPGGGAREQVRLLVPADRPELGACYARVFGRTHGMFARHESDFGWLDIPENRVAGFWEGGQLRGYAHFQFRKGATFNLNDIEVRELLYEDGAALAGLLAFFHSQADQIRHLVLNTPDPYFFLLPRDPRLPNAGILPHVHHESHVVGVGLMFRVLDLPLLLAALGEHNFGGASLTLAIEVRDNFLPENAGRTTVRFAEGRARLAPGAPADAEIVLDVADLSSMLVGAAPFSRLLAYGLARISDERHADTVDRLFRAPDLPVNVSRF